MLPMSLWAIERFFKERKIGWFIFAIAIHYSQTFILVTMKQLS